MPGRSGTFAYTEWHYRCARCNRTSIGGEAVGSEGRPNGWRTRAAARQAWLDHQKECDV